MSRGAWRRAVLVWVIAVAVGGGLTLWLRDSAEPPEPSGRHRTDDGDPAPLLRGDVEDMEDKCPPTLRASEAPEETPRTIVVCAYATLR
ncbi:hypothetical protein [Streptomyces sp. NRRL WC-3618]|uniref:hypothetical protein n=1 Tax=Streptomyces sp. NRRL WC-3618 TaxID=1519490 RepID=UPI000A3F81FA|nr:hypothetical protein [Streptomyces sp. NRRL WC-3618]